MTSQEAMKLQCGVWVLLVSVVWGGGGLEREHNEGWEEGYNSVHSLRKSTESFYEEVYGKITAVGRK